MALNLNLTTLYNTSTVSDTLALTLGLTDSSQNIPHQRHLAHPSPWIAMDRHEPLTLPQTHSERHEHSWRAIPRVRYEVMARVWVSVGVGVSVDVSIVPKVRFWDV